MDNKENSTSKQSGSAESYHSVHSQDTELIDESASSFDNAHNTSTITTSNNSDSLCVHTGSPQDHSLIDFITSPNQTSSAACSTPHERKLVSIFKSQATNSSEEQLVIKRQKLLKDTLEGNDFRLQIDSNSSQKDSLSESSHEELLPLSKQSDLLTAFKHPNVEYAEASSSSSAEKLITSSSFEHKEKAMVKKQRSPDYSRQKNDLRKKPNKKDRIKENEGQTFTEEVLCSISYVYDSSNEQIKYISIKKMTKRDMKQTRSSISSGSLADSSGSETNWISRQAPSKSHSNSSAVSSSSSCPSHSDKLPVNKFRIPQIPDPKKQLNFKYPKTCVCQCYCSNFIDILTKPRCFILETSSSSSENIKPDSQDLTMSSVHLGDLHNTAKQKDKIENLSAENFMNDFQQFRSRSSMYIPASNNLPVFAKWPSNSYCYPGIVENATEDVWHKSSHLEVKFCDGTVKKILSENLFPAYLLPSGTEISFEKDDVCEAAVLISIERLLNNELICLGESQKGIGETVNIPFEKIFLTNYCYKGLKKEMPDSLTPRKTPNFSISEANVQEGKRKRKNVKFESISPKQSSSTGRKTRLKCKRSHLTGSSSSFEPLKKRPSRFSSQKKLRSKKSEDQKSTPNVHSGVKKEASRKLYEESPGCSNAMQPKKSFEALEPISSTDTDCPNMQVVNIEEVWDQYLDSELIPDIPQRSTKAKSSLRKNNAGSKDNKVKGPIPEEKLFSGFNFVLTHASPKKNTQVTIKTEEPDSEEGIGTDYEGYFVSSVPFDYLRLREQITSGGGKVFRSILLIPVEEHKQTFLITDNIVETPNYVLAVSLRIPIYRHDLIVDCCIQGRNVSEMLGDAMKMPYGRSLLTGNWVESRVSNTPLKGFECGLCLTGNDSTINFWRHVLTNAGARVIYSKDIGRLITEFDDRVSFIVADEKAAMNFLGSTRPCSIPVVSTAFVLQCIIHGQQKLWDSHPQFKITL